MYEPGYYEKTYEYITATYMPMHYESNTREVTLRYCQSTVDEISRNFSFAYDVLGNLLFVIIILTLCVTILQEFCPVSFLIKTIWLHFFGHVACSDSWQDHHRVSLRPPDDWRRPRGCPHTTWLMYSQLTLLSTESGGRQWLCAVATYCWPGNTRLRGMPLK